MKIRFNIQYPLLAWILTSKIYWYFDIIIIVIVIIIIIISIIIIIIIIIITIVIIIIIIIIIVLLRYFDHNTSKKLWESLKGHLVIMFRVKLLIQS